MKRITSELFRQAFREEWMAQVLKAPPVLTSPEYPAPSTWTEFIEGSGGMLEGVMERLRAIEPTLAYCRQRYTVDACYVGGRDLYGSGLVHASELHCLIEHEHGNNVEVEMWKLIHWRAPLKILIFYDWNDWEKTGGPRRGWLSAKLAVLSSMVKAVGAHFPENGATEYLFLIGSRANPQQPPRWAVATPDTPIAVPFITK